MTAFSGSTQPRKTIFIAAVSIVLGVHATCPPPDNEWLEFGSSCYNFNVNNKKWVDAKASCQDRGAKLLVINSSEENDFITGEMAKKSLSRVWVGCRYDKSGKWLCYSDDVKEMTYTNWAQGEPRTSTNGCTAKYAGAEWYGINCNLATTSMFTVCETTSIAGGVTYTAPRLETCLVMDADGRPAPINPSI